MVSKHSWQNATNSLALDAAHRVESGMTTVDGVSTVDAQTLVDFTKSRASEELLIAAGIEKLIDELDEGRADGTIFTYGQLQERLAGLLADPRRCRQSSAVAA